MNMWVYLFKSFLYVFVTIVYLQQSGIPTKLMLNPSKYCDDNKPPTTKHVLFVKLWGFNLLHFCLMSDTGTLLLSTVLNDTCLFVTIVPVK